MHLQFAVCANMYTVGVLLPTAECCSPWAQSNSEGFANALLGCRCHVCRTWLAMGASLQRRPHTSSDWQSGSSLLGTLQRPWDGVCPVSVCPECLLCGCKKKEERQCQCGSICPANVKKEEQQRPWDGFCPVNVKKKKEEQQCPWDGFCPANVKKKEG
eukprot:1156753-Pelagomonas_calceolata.AAC.5